MNWMTISDVMSELGVARSTLDRWRSTGRGPAFKRLPNGELRLKREAFDLWVENLPEGV